MATFLGVAAPEWVRLPPLTLIERFAALLEVAAGYIGQLPADRLADHLPGRDRTLANLGNHVLAIAEAWLEVSEGAPFDALHAVPEPAEQLTPRALEARAALAAKRIREAGAVSWDVTLRTFYGPQTHHAVLERCTWHVAQHTRQLAYALETFGVEPEPPLGVQWLAGLPLPKGIWDG